MSRVTLVTVVLDLHLPFGRHKGPSDTGLVVNNNINTLYVTIITINNSKLMFVKYWTLPEVVEMFYVTVDHPNNENIKVSCKLIAPTVLPVLVFNLGIVIEQFAT